MPKDRTPSAALRDRYWWVAASAAAIAAACSIPDLDVAGTQCTETCPGNLPCTDGVCGGALDASVAEASSVEGGPVACPGPYVDAVTHLPGLLGYWRLDETAGTTAQDVTHQHPGTYQSAVTLGRPGLLVGDPDLAAGFSGGAGSYVDVPAASDLDLQTFTLGAIIQPSAIVPYDDGQQIIAKTNAYWLQLDAPANGSAYPSLEVGLTNGPTDYPTRQASANLGVGVVSHVVGTYDGSSVKIYVDGALVASVLEPSAIQVTTTDLFIGSWNGTSNFQKGVIDEAFVSSVALTSAQVEALYRAAKGCAYDAGE